MWQTSKKITWEENISEKLPLHSNNMHLVADKNCLLHSLIKTGRVVSEVMAHKPCVFH